MLPHFFLLLCHKVSLYCIDIVIIGFYYFTIFFVLLCDLIQLFFCMVIVSQVNYHETLVPCYFRVLQLSFTFFHSWLCWMQELRDGIVADSRYLKFLLLRIAFFVRSLSLFMKILWLYSSSSHKLRTVYSHSFASLTCCFQDMMDFEFSSPPLFLMERLTSVLFLKSDSMDFI